MKTLRTIPLLFLFIGSVGCSNGLVRLTGQLEENGQPIRLGERETVQLDFVTADGASLPLNLGIYAKPDGSFAADMNDGSGGGLPPGKYMIKLNHEGTKLTRKPNPKLFKVGHSVNVVKGATLHLKVDLSTGTITP